MTTDIGNSKFFAVRQAMHSRQLISSIFRCALCCLIALGPLSGCRSVNQSGVSFAPASLDVPSLDDSYLTPYDADIEDDPAPHLESSSPDQLVDYKNIQYVPISLDACIRQALADSKVFRDIGGAVISAPSALDSTFGPALIYSNATFGEDAALSAFDAVYSQSTLFEKNDRPFNTSFTGDTKGIFQQDLGEFNFQMTKLAATGTRFTSRGIVNYDDNNQAGNRFFHSWEPIVENEFRHPLMQGSGSQFNRIAGPSLVPGSFNGILIARTNTEMSLADFEAAVRDFIVNVENSYWDLYYAYRELNAQTDARDAAFEVYKNAEADAAEERVSTLEKASAYEQYLRFEASLVESLEGRPTEGTQAGSGSTGGVFRRNVGVRIAERRLRHLIGMTITDGALLQPLDQPNTTPVVFDWNESVDIAMYQRPETRRQRWLIKQRELQLVAARNFLQPRLDVVGRHRFRGLGRDLTGGEPFQNVIDSPNNNDNVSGGFTDLGTGNFQEWQLGLELKMPVGLRQAHAGVRFAELGVQRERTVLKEQERKILLDLSNAVADVRRSSSSMSVAEQRYKAAIEYRAQAAERIERGRAQFDVLLEAQRRVLESQVQFINAEVDNGIAVRNVHFERGTLLNYHGILLSENESDPAAYISANRRRAKRIAPMSYVARDQTIAKSKDDRTLTVPIITQVHSDGSVPLPVIKNETTPLDTFVPSAPTSQMLLPQPTAIVLPKVVQGSDLKNVTTATPTTAILINPATEPIPIFAPAYREFNPPATARPSAFPAQTSIDSNSNSNRFQNVAATPLKKTEAPLQNNNWSGIRLPSAPTNSAPLYPAQFQGAKSPSDRDQGSASPAHLNGALIPLEAPATAIPQIQSQNIYRGAATK